MADLAISFSRPELWLWALAAAGVLLGLRLLCFRRPRPAIYFPGQAWLRQHSSAGRFLPRSAAGCLWLAGGILFLGLGQPVYQVSREEVSAKGVDIVLLLDISTSMSAEDFQPANRLEAARGVLRDFIRRRSHDRLALITFAADAYVVCPLTIDHFTLAALLASVQRIPFDADGTAIGLALSSAVNRLRDSPAKSRVVVLLTDGINNRGEVSPLQAAEFCRTYGLKVYTIGIGTGRPTWVVARAADGGETRIQAVVDFDPEALAEIARVADGKSYLASDTAGLAGIYGEIDRLEKTVLEKRTVTARHELLPFLAGAAALLLLAALALWSRCPACL